MWNKRRKINECIEKYRNKRKIIKRDSKNDTSIKFMCCKEILHCVSVLTLYRAMIMRNNINTPAMMASTMIQDIALASWIFPTNIVYTSTWSGLSVN
jgi:hypothetical protein